MIDISVTLFVCNFLLARLKAKCTVKASIMNVTEKIYSTIKNLKCRYFTYKQLCGILCTKSTDERHVVAEVLTQLCSDGLVVYDEKNRRYRLAYEDEFGKAVFDANAKGFGFLQREDGDDLFVPADKTHGAFHRDEVLYRRVEGTADCAEILKVTKRGITQLVGTFDKTSGARFVVPDESKFISDVFVRKNNDMAAKNGQKVVVKILKYPYDNRNNPEGEIVQVLGYPNEKDVDTLSVAYAYGLNKDFPEACQKQAEKLPQSVCEKDVEGRVDLRSQVVFTIDGEDARDLDDAVSVQEKPDGTFTLGVHIADVSHYVRPGGDVDLEAFKRGTSVYFPQMVFPMLPTCISNGVCSLFEGVDRLTLSCIMQIDGAGRITDCDLFPSVIRSRHRLTYTAVQAIFDGDQQTAQRYADVLPQLNSMQKLAKILQNKRKSRGNLDFQTREVSFVFDDDGNVVDVVPYKHTFAHQLIEEFMIAANESVAEYAQNCQYPFVYRVHQKPDAEKYQNLLSILQGVGIKVKRSKEIHNSILQDALRQAEQTPYFALINDVALRSMQKAKYSTQNDGHFGLASDCYCHFTSPIRRYPDLVVHRILKTAVAGKMTEKALDAYEEMTENAARQCNLREKTADEAERKVDDFKKCRYAQNLVGQTFPAIISGVIERGIFCELENTVEGFVSAETLGFNAKFDAKNFCLTVDGKRYGLGDPVLVTVQSVNLQTARIKFALCLQQE